MALNYQPDDDSDDAVKKKKCTKSSHVMNFELEEKYVQDIYMFTTKDNAVQTPKKIGSKMNVKRYMTTQHTEEVGIPPTGESHSSFDTLWSCVFNLEPKKLTTREIWFVQNQGEKRTST